VLKNVVGKV
jgi:hypothetical protein